MPRPSERRIVLPFVCAAAWLLVAVAGCVEEPALGCDVVADNVARVCGAAEGSNLRNDCHAFPGKFPSSVRQCITRARSCDVLVYCRIPSIDAGCIADGGCDEDAGAAD